MCFKTSQHLKKANAYLPVGCRTEVLLYYRLFFDLFTVSETKRDIFYPLDKLY